jgi:pimeloyl-ACP methyl ester carboxylesterase
MIRHEYATANGVRLHYARAGQGKLMLFLHGFPEFWYAWRRQLAEFGKDHLAVAPDLRGYNLSDKPAELARYRVSELVEDVRALAAHLNGGRPFVLVGHDWGGAIAWAFAIRHPALVEKLVIVNAPHPGVFERELDRNPAQQQASQYMLLFRSPQAESTLAANNYAPLVEGVLGDMLRTGVLTEADKQAYLAAWSQPGALTGGLNYYRAARVGPPVEGRRDSIARGLELTSFTVNVPTLVIWGEKDTALLTGNLDGLEAFVPDLTVRRIPEGSHWVVHEKPAEVNRLIRDFLRR